MQVTTIGVDLAKNIFQAHGITEADEVAFNRPLRRAQVLPFFARLNPCLVGMEACSTSHYWARELTRLGHDVRLIPPMYVKPYVKRGKSDAIDAEAICEAVTRPTMRFVENKSIESHNRKVPSLDASGSDVDLPFAASTSKVSFMARCCHKPFPEARIKKGPWVSARGCTHLQVWFSRSA
jgi:hypothetical protein